SLFIGLPTQYPNANARRAASAAATASVPRRVRRAAGASTSLPALETQRRDLFRDEAHEEDHNGKENEQDRGVGDVRLRDGGPDGVAEAEQEGHEAQRNEDLQRAEDRDDFQQDEEELRAVARQLDLGLPHALLCLDGLERHAVARFD